MPLCIYTKTNVEGEPDTVTTMLIEFWGGITRTVDKLLLFATAKDKYAVVLFFNTQYDPTVIAPVGRLMPGNALFVRMK